MPKAAHEHEMKNRRKLIIALSAPSLGAPHRAAAQPRGRSAVVGFLGVQDQPSAQPVVDAFKQELRKFGYLESRNLTLHLRFADGRPERVPEMAAELVNLKPDVILSVGAVTTSALQKATLTIPIVMATSADPVRSGFVKTLARPGGNITGLSNLGFEIGAKHLELLLNMVPNLTRVVVLGNPSNRRGQGPVLSHIQSAARAPGVTILPVQAGTIAEIESAFSAMVRDKAGAVIVLRDGFFIRQGSQIADLARKYGLASISDSVDYVKAGGLMSYGVNLEDQFRRAASYVDRILKGAQPADLPVEQPVKFELAVNGNTARTLGLAIPQAIRISLDKVID